MHSGNDNEELILSASERREMLAIAEGTVTRAVEAGGTEPTRTPASNERLEQLRRGTFVTLYVDGDLHGCIGSIEARRVLAEDVASNAYRAAFFDPRFPATRPEDLSRLDIHISVLGELQPMSVSSEEQLIDEVRVGEDGLLLVSGFRRGTFLPSVWEKVPSPTMFVQHLKRKAGIRPWEWPDDIQVYRYGVEQFDREMLTELH
jgi:AmmeMemoRadiSam system protein A